MNILCYCKVQRSTYNVLMSNNVANNIGFDK
jgi:hypothetical protein